MIFIVIFIYYFIVVLQPPGWPLQPALIDEKMYADVVEALIAAVFVSKHVQSEDSNQYAWTLAFMQQLGLLPSDSLPPLAPPQEYSQRYMPRVLELERILNYSFQDKNIAIEALTHKSAGGSLCKECLFLRVHIGLLHLL